MGSGRIEKERSFQNRRSAQPEAQEEASDASQERRKPIHQGTMRFQSQACVEDRQGIANEEVEGDDQLGPFRSEPVSLRPRWAVSPGLYLELCTSLCCSIEAPLRS